MRGGTDLVSFHTAQPDCGVGPAVRPSWATKEGSWYSLLQYSRVMPTWLLGKVFEGSVEGVRNALVDVSILPDTHMQDSIANCVFFI